jgi:hypothetical protein
MRVALAFLSVVALAFALPAAADPPDTFEFVEVFGDVNPCTGEAMTVTFVGTAYVHEHGSRILARNQRTITTSDGFAGRGADASLDNGQIITFRINDMMTNAAGDRFRAHGVFVGDVSTETTRVDRFELTCLTR